MGKVKGIGFWRRGKKRLLYTRDPVDGRRVSTGCTDIEAAKRWRRARELLYADPANAAAEQATLGEWIGKWLAMKERTASEATMRAARQKLGHWVRVLGEECRLSLLKPAAVDRYVALRRTEEVTDHTISKEVTHLVSVLKLAKRGGCYTGELDVLRPADLHVGYVPRKRALTLPELAALLSELEPHHGALVAVCVALGCRLGEAQRLLPTDIEAEQVLIRGTKTAGARRYVPILSVYRPLLDGARPWLPLARWDNVRRGLARACKRAGIDRVTPNDLRRTHATLLVEAGVDRDVIRRLLGHSTTTMLDRVYGQPSTQALAKLAEDRIGSTPSHEAPAFVAKSRASLGNRTPDLRFTKPGSGVAETSVSIALTEENSPRTPSNLGERGPFRRKPGTEPSQAWRRRAALAVAAAQMGCLR